jgi:hypothetical protein
MSMEDFLFHMLIWGWSVQGHNDIALLAETGWADGYWDRTERDLANEVIYRDGVWRIPPLSWALAGHVGTHA